MGGGDIKLFCLIGFVLGVKLLLLSFFLSTLYGAVIGVLAILFRLVKKRQPIPFGPFIVAGTLTSYFWGSQIIHFYLRFLNNGF
jgi:leader peptidase (prepilin peptidase)/N-methyltransferase